MKNVNNDIDEIDLTELPVSGAVRVQRRRGYGRVPDLDDEAPADIGELRRIVAYTLYGPIIDLPGRGGRLGRIVLDADGELDWEAIGPAGGRRRRSPASRCGPAEELRAELARTLGLIGLVKPRLPGPAAYLVLRYVRMGILDVEHVTSHDVRELIRLEAKARRLREALAAGSRPVRPAVWRVVER
jgi:hypothetical protein